MESVTSTISAYQGIVARVGSAWNGSSNIAFRFVHEAGMSYIGFILSSGARADCITISYAHSTSAGILDALNTDSKALQRPAL